MDFVRKSFSRNKMVEFNFVCVLGPKLYTVLIVVGGSYGPGAKWYLAILRDLCFI